MRKSNDVAAIESYEDRRIDRFLRKNYDDVYIDSPLIFI